MNKIISIIVDPIEDFVGRKLPLIKEVIAVFFYQRNILKEGYKSSLQITIEKLEEKWSEAGIPTCGKKYALKKFEKILRENKKLQKSSQRKRSATQKKNEAVFYQKVTRLFDIGKLNVEQHLSDYKKLFLLGQRSNSRFGLIDNVVQSDLKENTEHDMDVESAGQRSNNRFELIDNVLQSNLEENTEHDMDVESAIFQSYLSGTTSRHVSTDVSDLESESSQPKEVLKVDVMTPELCAALDRSKVTHRKATFILAAAYKSVGIDLSTLNLSYSTIYRARIKYRSEIAKDMKSEFHKDDRYVVHWDGKILSDIRGTQTVDRIAVLLSVSGVDQLLGVPKTDDGTSLKQASAIIDTLDLWEVAPYVRAMCFDTPPVNTGIHKGTCVEIEKALGRKLVWLPCRHHIMEIVLRGVFDVFWNTTSGPNVPIFVRFKNYWDKVDHSNYKSGMEDETIANTLQEKKTEIVAFINNCLEMSQPRDDYRELLLLSLVFLDSSSEDSFSFKRPGAMHHARWMSKAIYSLKIFLFRDQFNLSAQEKKNLRRICIFVILFYIRVWFNSTSAIQAPNNDLEFIKILIQSKNTDPPVLQRACQKMIKHLWYLNEELVTISLFDSNLSVDIKKKIVVAIQNRENSTPIRQRYEITEQNLQSVLGKDLSDFASKNSLQLFKKFDLPCDFLENDISTWSNNDSYKECLNYFNTLKVTNDVAERGIALIEEYNNCITKDEEQLQYLLQVVREHRLRYPNYNKTTLQQHQFNLNM